MKKEFRDAYNRELALLYERSAEFASEHPGIADRLGGLLQENIDPAVAGLLEGTAFLAARVQLKIDDEFSTFTTQLLEQIFPDALAPIPSVMLVEANPEFENDDLSKGLFFKVGDGLDARFVDAEERVSCMFRLCTPLVVWPLKLTELTYHDTPASLTALGRDAMNGTRAGLQMTITRPKANDSANALAALQIDELPVYFTGNMPSAIAVYEQIHCDLKCVTLRYLNKNGDPVFIRMDPASVEQIGFNENERLIPRDTTLFDGFAQLREAFIFPRKYLGFRLTGLKEKIQRMHGDEFQIIFEFGHLNKTLAARVNKDFASLNAATAINLFEESATQVRLDERHHEYVLTPYSSPVTHYEIHKIIKVTAHYPDGDTTIKVQPLYALPDKKTPPRQAFYYTSRKKQRRLTKQEQQFGLQHNYRGSETFIAFYEPPVVEGKKRVNRLRVKTLCSNRHLPEYLPIAESRDDFHMSNDSTTSLACVSGPTPPREAMTELEQLAPHRATQGDVYWRLISYLSLSHFGLGEKNGRDSTAGLRELLSLFANLSDTVTETQIQGIIGLENRPIVRSIQRGDGYFPARGIEIKITFDEDAFEGSGVILLGAVLDRFFSEYASINSFTQTVIASTQRGVIKTWPARTGNGALI